MPSCRSALPVRSTLALGVPQNTRDHKDQRLIAGKRPSFLRVIDGMLAQPMLIAYPANVLQHTSSNAGGQTAVFPSDARAKTDCAAQQAIRQCSAYGFLTAAWKAAQHTEARSKDGGLQGTSD